MCGCCFLLCRWGLFCLPCALGPPSSSFTKFWLMFWLFMNVYFFPEVDFNQFDTIDSLTSFIPLSITLSLEAIAYYIFILLNAFMLFRIFRNQNSQNFYTRDGNFYTMNCFQCMLMLYTLSSFPMYYRPILQGSPLFLGILYGYNKRYTRSGIFRVFCVWIFGNSIHYLQLGEISSILGAIFYWFVLPCIECIVVGLACLAAGIFTNYSFSRSRQMRLFTASNRNFSLTNVDSGNLFAILFANLMLVVLHLVLILVHGYDTPINSFAFFVTYLYPLTELAIYSYNHETHKCSEQKARLLSYSSIVFSAYFFRYLFNV